MNISKTLQASAFCLIVLNLVEKVVLHFLLIMLDSIKSALRKKQLITSTQSTLKENCRNTKNINFQFHYGKFSQQTYSALSYCYRCVTKGKRGEISPVLSRKLEKSSLIFGKNALIVAIYGLNFSFKIHFLSYSRRKNPKSFPGGPVFFVL